MPSPERLPPLPFIRGRRAPSDREWEALLPPPPRTVGVRGGRAEGVRRPTIESDQPFTDESVETEELLHGGENITEIPLRQPPGRQ